MAPPMEEPASPELVIGVANFAARATQMVSAARMEIVLLSLDLDRRVYGSGAFTESLRRFVLQHSHTKVRILVNATQAAMAHNPRLVEFGRSLSSFVEFRELLEPRRPVVRQELLIADGRTMLFKESSSDLEAKYFGAQPLAVKEKLKEFQMLWDESEPAQELRRLGA
jgi:hypothetical protein